MTTMPEAPPPRPRWLKVLAPADLPEGGLRGLRCAGHDVCVARQGGRVAAFDDVCPHQGSPLSTGWLWDGLVVCPWHGWAYDPHTGAPSSGLGAPLRCLPVEERPDGIYVALPEDAAPTGGPRGDADPG